MTLPVERSVRTLDDYVDQLVESAPEGLDREMPTDIREVLEANISRDGDRIVHHGVAYDSLDELVYFGSVYPLSNDDDLVSHAGLRRMLPYRSPFLDNRLVDLSLSMPIRYRLRKNVINRAVERLAPELAAIPHASTGVALSRSFVADYVGLHLNEFWQKHVSPESPPKPYLTNGPWLNDRELLRSDEFFLEALEEVEDVADALPGPDADAIRETYRAHCDGENRVVELYNLLTALTMPVTEHIVSDGETGEAPSRLVPHTGERPAEVADLD